MAIFITVFALFALSYFLERKVFPKLYRQTHKNPFTFFHKVLCAVMGIFFIILIPFEDNNVWGYGVLVELIAIGLTVLLNLKYKDPKLIAKVTAIQVVFGISFSGRFFLWLLILALNFGGIVLGQSWSLSAGFPLFGKFKLTDGEVFEGSGVVDAVIEAGKQNADSVSASINAEKERNNEAAEAYARSYGFESADEAEDYGLKTGKKD